MSHRRDARELLHNMLEVADWIMKQTKGFTAVDCARALGLGEQNRTWPAQLFNKLQMAGRLKRKPNAKKWRKVAGLTQTQIMAVLTGKPALKARDPEKRSETLKRLRRQAEAESRKPKPRIDKEAVGTYLKEQAMKVKEKEQLIQRKADFYDTIKHVVGLKVMQTWFPDEELP